MSKSGTFFYIYGDRDTFLQRHAHHKLCSRRIHGLAELQPWAELHVQGRNKMREHEQNKIVTNRVTKDVSFTFIYTTTDVFTACFDKPCT